MAYTKRRKVTLPVDHHEQDSDWLESELLKLHPRDQIYASTAYSGIYAETMNTEPVEHKRVNRARRAANLRMREFVAKKKVLATSMNQERVAHRSQQQSNFNLDNL